MMPATKVLLLCAVAPTLAAPRQDQSTLAAETPCAHGLPGRDGVCKTTLRSGSRGKRIGAPHRGQPAGDGGVRAPEGLPRGASQQRPHRAVIRALS